MDQDAADLVAHFPASYTDAPPPPAANPSPSAAAAPPSHPSYAEMITAAIVWGRAQGREGGSSKRAIAKYIDRVYTNLPPTHSALLTHHLKRLKNSGHLVMVKNSYELPSAASHAIPPPGSAAAAASQPPPVVAPPPQPTVAASPVSANSTPKRRPGRPPKLKPVVLVSSNPVVPISSNPVVPSSFNPVVDNGSGSGLGLESGKKRRGRPPKQQMPQQGAVAAEVPFVQPVSGMQPQVQPQQPQKLVNGEASVGQKRRGRPPKQQQPVQPPVVQFAQLVVEAAPPIVQGSGQVVMAEAPKRRPGRPPKAKNAVNNVVAPPEMSVGGVTMARPRGRPKRNALGLASSPVGKSPRGRPKRLGGDVGAAAAVGMGVKRRGRPPRVGGGGLGVRRRTGRPVGRPRKDAFSLRDTVSDQGMANEELMTKFQLVQSKIREAVAIIRPCVADGTALTVLQELEELSVVNLTATSTVQQVLLSPAEAMEQGTNSPPTPAVPLNMAVPASEPQTTTTETAPLTGATATFDVTGPTMNVSAPATFHAPPGMESQQHPMSWFPSNEAES